MVNPEVDYYDFHGFKVQVSGPARAGLAKEFWYFKVEQLSGNPDLILKCAVGPLPTNVVRGTNEAVKLPLAPGEHDFLYTPKTPRLTLVAYTEALLGWPDKTIIHASAVVRNGQGWLFCGPENTGKTSSALNLVKRGFDYLSDDWSIIGSGLVYPFPKTIHVYPYNLSDRELARRVFGSKLPLFKLLFSSVKWLRQVSPFRVLNLVIDRHPFYYEVPVTKLYPGAKIGRPVRLEKVFFLQREKISWPKLQPDIEAIELADRMSHFTFYEKGSILFKEYARQVVISGQTNEHISRRLEHDRRVMIDTFAKTKNYRLRLPIDFNLSAANLPDLLSL